MKNHKYGSLSLSFWVVLFLVFGIFAPFTFAAPIPVSVALSPSKDTWVDQANPGVNFGTSTDINILASSTANGRGLVTFDVSSTSVPTNAIITSAVVSFFVATSSESDRVYNLDHINDIWSEATSTWANQPSTGATLVASSSIASTSANTRISWDVTSEVSKMISGTISNEGWMIKDSVENGTSTVSRLSVFRSREFSNTSERPQLIISYILPATATISGTVFNDLNNDGQLSVGETGLSGWTVTLSGDKASTTVTNASGGYSFGPLDDGLYHICQTLASSTPPWQETSVASGFNCGSGLFGYSVTISSSTSVVFRNFGNFKSSTTTLSVPTLLLPANGSTVAPAGLTLDWSDVVSSSTPVSYLYQISTSPATSTQNSLITTSATSSALTISQASVTGLPDNTYYWQVRVCNASSTCSNWSDTFKFILSTPSVPSPVVTTSSGGGNGPISGSYGVVSGTGGASGANLNATYFGGGRTTANGSVAPTTLPAQYIPPVVAQNVSTTNVGAGGKVVVKNKPVVNVESKIATTTSEATTTSGITRSDQLPPSLTQNNLEQTAAATKSGGWASLGFWAWAAIALIIIGLIIYFFRRNMDG